MRNANGAGTCFRLKGRRRHPYIARAFLGWKEVNGKLIPDYQTIGYFETRQEGNDALTFHRHNPVSPKANMTLSEVYEEWSERKYNRKKISKATENNYRAAWKYIKKYEKNKFKELRTSHWQEIIDKCEESKLSASTLKKTKTLGTLLYDYAIKNDVVNKNYAKFIEIPETEKTKEDRFSDLEIKKLFDSVANEWINSVLIMIYTGMRISEMLNLTRFQVNLKQGIITGGIKTDAGKDRIIPIHPKIFKYIKQWYDKNGQALICEESGKGLSAKRYRENYYYPALEAAGVRKLTPHKCRHTFCSLLADAGADTISIQKLAGHTDYAFTANKYTHPEIETLRKAINKI